MKLSFDERIREFITACQDHDVHMILVGGGAVNFHGYQRHSADVDFWLELSLKNLQKLKRALLSIDIEIIDFPQEVYQGMQNISIKVSPVLELELITRFNPGKSFAEAYADSNVVAIEGFELLKYKVISLSDLLEAKTRSARPKDLLDIIELKKIHKLE